MRAKMRPKKRNKFKPKSRANYVKGLVISWTDKNPLDDTHEVMPGVASHRNAIHRLHAKKILDSVDWNAQYAWKITITVVFDYGNSVQREIREIEAFCVLGDIDGICNSEIKDAIRHGGADQYIHVEFVVECVGHHPEINFNVDNELREAMA